MPVNGRIGIHPPFVQSFDWLKEKESLQFGVLTGDVVRRSDKASWERARQTLSSLPTKIHIAPGNHDLKDKKLFQELYSSLYYSFQEGNDLHIVLDGNEFGWNIEGEQFNFLKEVLATKTENINNIFIYVHQVIWWKDTDGCDLNSLEGKADTLNFQERVLPLLRETNKPVYCFAGDVGAIVGKQNLCVQKDNNVFLIASGMGNEQKDHFVYVEVSPDGQVALKLIGLNCQEEWNCLGELSDYLEE